jgi:zinc protease
MRFVFTGLLLSLCSAAAIAGPTHEYRLTNGLKLIVKEDHRTPLVAFQVWYKIGSSYEPWGITGISHMLEHMMFKGTEKYPGNTFSTLMAGNGADQNASTGEDYTFYYQELPADKLPLNFSLEADRMHNLTLPPSEFKKEIEVVKEERRLRIDDNPQMLAFERFEAAAYISTNYHHPIIGWMNDLQHMTVGDARQWYKTWYAPNNATIVVVGDVQPEKILALTQKYFGAIPANPLPKLKPQQEVPSLGMRQVQVNTRAQLPWLLMGYNVPSLASSTNNQEAYALEVLAAVLDGGSSARLSTDLIHGASIATEASAYYELYSRLSTLLILSATPAQGHTLTEMQNALLAQIRRLQEQPITSAELARVRAQVTAHRIYSLDSLNRQAIEMGALESVGLSWQVADDYVKKIHTVTPEQVQAVARKYLNTDRLTVTYLQPKS